MRERKKPDYGFGFCRKCGAQYKRGGATAKYCAPCAKSMRLVCRCSYWAAHREELAAKKRAYNAAHREEQAAKMRAYYAAHREEKAAKYRAYNAAHREELAAKKRAYWAAHREEIVAKKRAYNAAHREEQAAKERARRQISGLLKLMVAADSVRRVMDVQQQQTKG